MIDLGMKLYAVNFLFDTLQRGYRTLYELRVSVADGGAFDLSETEKEIKISAVLAK